MSITFSNNVQAELPAWASEEIGAGGIRSYFETKHNDQWIAQATTERFRLASGDMGWQTIEIENPNYQELLHGLSVSRTTSPISGSIVFRTAVLTQPEVRWLTSVLLAFVELR